jgi:hypothetical protein
MSLFNILTNPGNFRFYAGGRGYVSQTNRFGQLSIPYGKDTIGGGNSNQPYIRTSIPAPNQFTGFVGNPGGMDELLRGGSNHNLIAAQDVSRIKQWFEDTKFPGSQIFLSKQKQLSRQRNLRVTGTLPLDSIYRPENTLAQIAANQTGYLHLLKQGNAVTPDAVLEYSRLYKVLSDGGQNKLVYLYKDKISNTATRVENAAAAGLFGIAPGTNLVLQSYPGGPGPGNANGFGLTVIPRTSFTPSQYKDFPSTVLTFDQKDIAQVGTTNGYKVYQGESIFNVEDFRRLISGKGNTNQNKSLALPTDYISFNRYTAEGAKYQNADSGRRGLVRKSYVVGSYENGQSVTKSPSIDQLSLQPLYISSSVNDTTVPNDFIKFYISSISNDDPQNETFIHFRAYLQGGIRDSFGSEYNEFRYVGRGEKFYVYQGFNREIGFQLDIVALHKAELLPLYRKLNYLVSLNAPDYEPSSGAMRGNIVKLTLGDYLNEVPGIFTRMDISIPDEASFDLARTLNGEIDTTTKQLPMMVSLQISFTPIHSFVPQKVSNNYVANPFQQNSMNAPFISLGDKNQGYYPTLEPLSPLPTPEELIDRTSFL